MKIIKDAALLCLRIVWYTLLITGIVTALSWVIGVLSLVAMFAAVLVPFWAVYPLLAWLFQRK